MKTLVLSLELALMAIYPAVVVVIVVLTLI
jgi:hypothetical protein